MANLWIFKGFPGVLTLLFFFIANNGSQQGSISAVYWFEQKLVFSLFNFGTIF
jgi:hypothetical protein